MKLVIPLRRVLPEERLEKARAGAHGGAHKYIRRQRVFSGGKLTWRYFYRDDEHRGAVKQHVDPHDKHEHHLEHEVKELHPNLKGKALKAIDATLDFIKGLFGFGGKASKIKVSSTEKWNELHHGPDIKREEDGEGKRSQQARIAKALELIPEHLKEYVQQGKIEAKDKTYRDAKGVTKFVMTDITDEDLMMQLFGAAGWYLPTNGEIHITSLAKGKDVGEAKFRGDLTWMEQVVTHEFGHGVHFNLMADKPDVWRSWTELSDGPGQKISGYAGKNEKEDFAESFACALTHPKELADRCPERYDWMREHVIPELKERSEMLATPDEELAWWIDKPSTPATQLLNQARQDHPATRFASYYSDKDQFYSVNKDGRQIYLRVGPPDKQSEAGWERMPPTLDPQTGLPRYEGGLYNKFRTQAIKEIYDEKGQPLDEQQAYLYLGQDDEKAIALAHKLAASGKEGAEQKLEAGESRKAVDALYDQKGDAYKKQRGQLGRTMFDNLGGNLFTVPKKHKGKSPEELDKVRHEIAGTLEYERRRVARARKKGESGAMDRHDWTPIEISGQEFMEKSGTFKFANVAEAPMDKQTHRLLDPDTGKTLTRFDPARGEHVPLLGSKLYEQQNPDGSWTKVRVSEENAFNVGETIMAPQKLVRIEVNPDADDPAKRYKTLRADNWATMPKAEKKKYEGMPRQTFTKWAGFTIAEGMQTDPESLARYFDTTAADLLEANNRYGRGQIMDPVLSELLNPGGLKTITCAAELQAAMREAAESDPPRRAWVSIQGESRLGVEQMPVAHIQVEWDGAGAPVVVGDYWAKKLGKTSIRLDELLTKQNQIKLPRIVERKGEGKKKARANTPGDIVWVTDPKTGRRVMATYVNRTEVEGKTMYDVQPLAGQGAGVQKRVMSVDKITARKKAEIPTVGKIGRVRRFVEPLDSDLLLYADEVPQDSGPADPDGVIRILLPKDGSIGFEQLKGAPGVQFQIKPDPDQMALEDIQDAAKLGIDISDLRQPPIGIRTADLPEFRKWMGGFVMDSRVRNMLKQAVEQERALQERYAGEQVVEREDLEDERGNINPDGPLGGLVTGDEGIQPSTHRIKLLQKIAKNGGACFAAHFMGTGKTAAAIMAAEMMRNLKDPEGNPHPNRTTKRCMYVAPPNTLENWYQEFKKFAGAPPTLLGTSSLAGAVQMPQGLPHRKDGESDGAFRKRIKAAWEAWLKDNPNGWNPWTDVNKNVVIGIEYFRDHGDAILMLDQFDGIVGDEAHKFMRQNEVSRVFERWRPSMKFFLPMSGTPITNTLHTLPRLARLVSNGEVDLPEGKEFEDTYLVESQVAKANGARNPPKTDLNPTTAGRLMSMVAPYIDFATSTDVEGQAMPAVLLDENQPAHMTGMQATMYRAAMADMTPTDREALGTSSALGIDEQKLLSPDARKKVAVARNIANSGAYKAPDLREELQYEAEIAVPDPKRKTVNIVTQNRAFRLPDFKTIMAKKGDGAWNGRYPDAVAVRAKRISPGYLEALYEYSHHLFGVPYEELAGRKLGKGMLEAIKKGEYETATGQDWTGRVSNPDYGPEGMLCRGKMEVVSDPTTGTRHEQVVPLPYKWHDESGAEHEGEIDPGTLFVRDSNRKALGLFFHTDDWDHTGRFDTGVEGEESEDKVDQLKAEGWEDHPTDKKKIWHPDLEEERDKPKGWAKKTAREQGPKEGREGMDVQRSLERRRERAMFDATVTHNNAKCDAMEEYIENALDAEAGDPDGEMTQFIHFGNRIAASVRTAEAKLRQMGYQDVNEALGNADVSSPADKARRPRKYFVTYMGKGATLGDRNINSEIFRRHQDQYGKSTGVSLFVYRTLYGNTKRPLKLGEIKEGWSRRERVNIASAFQDGFGRTTKDGSPKGLEVPMRQMGVEGPNGTVVPNYVYESDMSGKDKAELKRLERAGLAATGSAAKKIEEDIRNLLQPYWTDREPLSEHQQYVFNNTQHMLASDAANVGLNWPAKHLIMYDSLFSPLDEWQRITRAARMLPPAVSKEAAPIVDKIDAWIRQNETNQMRGIVDYDQQTALAVIRDAMDSLNVFDQAKLATMAEGSPEQLIEAYFAKRSLERMAGLREETEAKLRREGYWPDPDKKAYLQSKLETAMAEGDQDEIRRLTKKMDEIFVKPQEIQSSDVTNSIIREQLSPFERKMMRDRKFLVQVKRLTTSCELPEYEEIEYEIEVKGKLKKVKEQVPTGEMVVESPVKAERAVLTQGRVKMTAVEQFQHAVSNARPQPTAHDFKNATVRSMASTSTIAGDDGHSVDFEDESIHFDERLKKSMVRLIARVPRAPQRPRMYLGRA
jgi:hypothetical protein